jgi:hypothetical protein
MRNNEKPYDEKISPLMDQIIEICQENKIPMAAQFVVTENEDPSEDLLCSTALPHENKQIMEVVKVMINNPKFIVVTISKGDLQ